MRQLKEDIFWFRNSIYSFRNATVEMLHYCSYMTGKNAKLARVHHFREHVARQPKCGQSHKILWWKFIVLSNFFLHNFGLFWNFDFFGLIPDARFLRAPPLKNAHSLVLPENKKLQRHNRQITTSGYLYVSMDWRMCILLLCLRTGAAINVNKTVQYTIRF